MAREILLVTPENIEIEYELGGIGSRFLALLFDTMMQVFLYIGVGIIGFLLALLVSWLATFSRLRFLQPIGTFLEGSVMAIGLIAFFLVTWGYFIWFEMVWNGQTPGKRQLGLRVIRDGGYPINIYAAIVRNLLRVVDAMPLLVLGLFIGGLGERQTGIAAIGGLLIIVPLCFMLFTARYQRLGDFVAGTMVVKQRAPRVPTLEALAPPPRVLPEHLAPYALADIGKHVFEMTVPEYRAVRHYTDRRWQLPAPMQQIAAMRLAVPLMERLGIRPPAGVLRVNYADFLEYLAVAFEQYRGVK